MKCPASHRPHGSPWTRLPIGAQALRERPGPARGPAADEGVRPTSRQAANKIRGAEAPRRLSTDHSSEPCANLLNRKGLLQSTAVPMSCWSVALETARRGGFPLKPAPPDSPAASIFRDSSTTCAVPGCLKPAPPNSLRAVRTTSGSPGRTSTCWSPGMWRRTARPISAGRGWGFSGSRARAGSSRPAR